LNRLQICGFLNGFSLLLVVCRLVTVKKPEVIETTAEKAKRCDFEIVKYCISETYDAVNEMKLVHAIMSQIAEHNVWMRHYPCSGIQSLSRKLVFLCVLCGLFQ